MEGQMEGVGGWKKVGGLQLCKQVVMRVGRGMVEGAKKE